MLVLTRACGGHANYLQVITKPLRTLGYMRQVSSALSHEDEAANLRVWQMYDEARRFADLLVRFQDSLGAWVSAHAVACVCRLRQCLENLPMTACTCLEIQRPIAS